MLVVDTGPLVAIADTDDANHVACRALLEGHHGPLVTTALVIAEAADLIDRQLGPTSETALYDSILEGTLRVEQLDAQDWGRVRELVQQYASLRLGGTDASVVAVAERLDVTEIATLNHRHFRVVRPATPTLRAAAVTSPRPRVPAARESHVARNVARRRVR